MPPDNRLEAAKLISRYTRVTSAIQDGFFHDPCAHVFLASLFLTTGLTLAACGPGHSQATSAQATSGPTADGFSGQGFNAVARRTAQGAGARLQGFVFAPIVKSVAPAVVNVYATGVVRQQVDPFWSMFYGIQPRQQVQKVPRAQASSCAPMASSSPITTSSRAANQFMVVLNDRREYPAKVLLADPRSDLAVLKIDTKAVPRSSLFLTIDDGHDQQVGDLVLAIGNPFGVGQTVTNGIISALDRTEVGEGSW